MNKNIQGHLFALTANILWGLMAPIGKSALVEFSALSVTTFRMVGAAACFWLLSLFCKREQVDHRDMLKIFFAALFALIIRKTKCFDFWERNVLFPKTKRSFFRTPKHPLPCPFPLNFSLLIITKKFGNLAKNRYICIV